MKIHLITATVLGLAGAGFAMSPSAFAYTNTMGNNAGMTYNNGAQGYGNTGNYGPRAYGGPQPYGSQNNGRYAGGTASRHEPAGSHGWTRNNGWIGSSGNGASQNTGCGA